MNTPHEVFVVVHDDQSIEAFDTQDAARNATRDDRNPYVECVPIQYAPQVNDFTQKRRSWVSPPGIFYPGTGGDAA